MSYLSEVAFSRGQNRNAKHPRSGEVHFENLKSAPRDGIEPPLTAKFGIAVLPFARLSWE
jgi:hypothetical protein